MNTDGTDDNSFVMDIGKQQAALAAQLSPAISTMHHIDELLQWLSYAIVRNFNAQLVQCWVNQINQAGRLTVQLRTLVRQDASFPEQLAISEPMTLIAQRVISERRSYKPQPLENLFPPYQTTLLKRYGMHYCGACFTSRNALLPQPENMIYQERPPAVLAMATVLFLRQAAPFDFISVISSLLDQAVAIAEHRGLLIAHATVTPPILQFSSPLVQQETMSTAIDQLIPHRKQDANLMLADNPFASKAIISDKAARRLHLAIDGQSNIATLSASTGMNIKETYEALRKLLKQNRIDLYEPNGQPAKNPLFPNEF
jgi:hypothetical protein